MHSDRDKKDDLDILISEFGKTLGITKNSIILVLCDYKYNFDDYIESYEDFVNKYQ